MGPGQLAHAGHRHIALPAERRGSALARPRLSAGRDPWPARRSAAAGGDHVFPRAHRPNGSTGQLAGAWGEEFTREELAKAKRRGLIWGWVDSIETNGADIDHLVVLRSGAIVAMDSKWRRDAEDTARLGSDAAAAKRSARRAAVVLNQLQSTKSVTALVTVWGTAQHELHGRKISGIEFISGRKVRTWLRQHQAPPCERSAAEMLLADLRTYTRSPSRRAS